MIFLLISLIVIVFYFYGTRNFKYWENQGVQFERPLFLVGSSFKQFTDKVSLSQRYAKLYSDYPNEKFVGFFEGNDPAILIRDPEIVKQVLITDFRHFHRRGILPPIDPVETLLKNLFRVDGDIWKLMRKKLTPFFSSRKLKAIFPLIVERTEKLTKIANKVSQTSDEIDVKELMARYTTDFIGACGFGLDSVALDEENSEFRRLGKRIFTITLRDHVVTLLKNFAPKMFKNVPFFDPEIETKTISFVTQIMAQRNYKPSSKNDFIDFMLELRKEGVVEGESIEKCNPDGSPKIVKIELEDLLLSAQVFIFFAAGFETSSSASSWLLHQLAFHPEVQERCQREVDEVLKKYDGKLCFDAVKDMKYTEMALKESIRCLPSPGFLMRQTSGKYSFPGTNVSLEDYNHVIISVQGMCHDEKYFEDPELFIPERFHPDNNIHIMKCTFLPFGDGPRSCIGERLGIMQSMAGVAAILKKFTVSPSRSTLRKPIIDHFSTFVETIVGGLPLNLKRRPEF